ncbi:MAG TPA: RNA 2',3'-cyclic phosphodiesterase [Candidatus Bathyarchaeia archaeon]|nr:RNA 2',3'-cyclic phosphodiesterase [Candidatus Bathyarchaeia archaeon]
MRAFISLDLPDKIKTEIKKIQQELRRTNVQAKWVDPEISHLTLAFLGSIPANKVAPINQILENKTSQIKTISLYLSKLGCFPNPANPRVVFVDLGGELDKLSTLTQKIRKGFIKEKIWFDKKPFLAHLTLGRIKKRKNLTEVLKKIKVKRIKFQTKEISLNKSRLGSTGPAYTKLKKIFLT